MQGAKNIQLSDQGVLIAQGCNGTAWFFLGKNQTEKYIVKKTKPQFKGFSMDQEAIVGETLLSRVGSQYVVPTLGYYEEQGNSVLIMEYAPFGSLADIIHEITGYEVGAYDESYLTEEMKEYFVSEEDLVLNKPVLAEAKAKFIIANVACMLSAFHKSGFRWNDLKPRNLLFTESGYLRAIDFGNESKFNSDNQVDWSSLGRTIAIRACRICKKNVHRKLVSSQALEVAEALSDGKITSLEQLAQYKWFQGFDWKKIKDQTMPSPFQVNKKSIQPINSTFSYTPNLKHLAIDSFYENLKLLMKEKMKLLSTAYSSKEGTTPAEAYIQQHGKSKFKDELERLGKFLLIRGGNSYNTLFSEVLGGHTVAFLLNMRAEDSQHMRSYLQYTYNKIYFILQCMQDDKVQELTKEAILEGILTRKESS